jgi:hypothetical protein
MSATRLHLRKQIENCKKKRSFASEETAIIAIRDDAGLRPYKCQICGNWHLTSSGEKREKLRMPPKKRNKTRNKYGRRKNQKGRSY